MDAALFKYPDKFVIIEAKGDPSKEWNGKQRSEKSIAASISSGLTNILGTILKRIKIESGYIAEREKEEKFKTINGINEDIHIYMQKHALLKNCEYVLAVPGSYPNGMTRILDPQLAVMLTIVVYTVSDSDVTRLYW